MFKKSILILFSTFFILSCGSDDSSPDTSSDGFDRALILTNWADNIIIPVYEDLNTKLEELVNQKELFNANPNPTQLQNLRTAWKDAYLVWQHAEMFNVGMAESINYVFQMNVYPTNVQDIQANILSRDYDLSSVNNNDAVGFPAVDYMLYGLADTDAEILNWYTTSAEAEAYKMYLSDLTTRMKSLTQTVLDDWKNGYRDNFVESTDNTATGAINIMANDFIFYYEKGFRANKFGIPAGNFSPNPLPDRVEAYYKEDFSKTLALEALLAIEHFFNGIAYNTRIDSDSFDDYLGYVNTISSGEDLNVLINDQFEESRSKINMLNDSFVQQIENNNVAMTEAFDAIQMGVVLLKVDMLQALDISVDFVDADGD